MLPTCQEAMSRVVFIHCYRQNEHDAIEQKIAFGLWIFKSHFIQELEGHNIMMLQVRASFWDQTK